MIIGESGTACWDCLFCICMNVWHCLFHCEWWYGFGGLDRQLSLWVLWCLVSGVFPFPLMVACAEFGLDSAGYGLLCIYVCEWVGGCWKVLFSLFSLYEPSMFPSSMKRAMQIKSDWLIDISCVLFESRCQANSKKVFVFILVTCPPQCGFWQHSWIHSLNNKDICYSVIPYQSSILAVFMYLYSSSLSLISSINILN